MNRIMKRVCVLVLAFAITGLSGCMVKPQEPEKTNAQPSSDASTGAAPQTEEQTTGREIETTAQTTEKVLTLSEKIANYYAVRDSAVGCRNFTMSVKQNGEEQTIKIDPDATMYDDNKIFSFEGNKRYWYNLENNVWVREVTEDEDPSEKWVDWMASFEIMGYDDIEKIFEGSDKNNHGIVMYEIPGGFYFSCGDTEVEVTGIGETEIKIPRRWEEREEQIVDVSLVNADGSYKLDLMKSLLWDWVNGDNQFGKDILSYRSRNDNLKTQRILFVNPTAGALRFGAVIKNQNGTYFNTYSIENIDYSTQASFVNSLRQISTRQAISVVNENVQIDTSASDEDVATRTANVMNFLGKGDEEVVDVCESVRLGSTLTYGSGLAYRELIVTRNEVYLVTIDTRSKQDVLENTSKWDAQLTKTDNITTHAPELILQ